ncbi:late IMV membrane protein [Cetacean poxvirus 1]|nr:late IMV membrane protein [Cetacean poxvirus 1]
MHYEKETDEEIYAFCMNNKNDIRCKCIYPDENIIKIGKETRLPYYCWYEPCKLQNAKLPLFLKKNISRCNVSDCNISLGRVSINDGIFDVRNVCGSKLTKTDITPIMYLHNFIYYPIISPIWIPLGLIVLSLLILISN